MHLLDAPTTPEALGNQQSITTSISSGTWLVWYSSHSTAIAIARIICRLWCTVLIKPCRVSRNEFTTIRPSYLIASLFRDRESYCWRYPTRD
ncbi:hypothetical protein PM082_004966 [Marasmius tenuissimus]|nr:hypothetical protein PM082_004966 [Marasmius tenuissimus]